MAACHCFHQFTRFFKDKPFCENMIRAYSNSVFNNRVSTLLGYPHKASLPVDFLNFFDISLGERIKVTANNNKRSFRINVI